MANLDVDGGSFEYVQRGAGEALVLVHGSASDYRTWEAQLAEFGEDYRTIAYSRRYHWPNRPIPDDADYRMEEHVEDLRVFLRSLDAAPAHLVGHSYGAFVCLLLAMEEPPLVRTLVLTEPPAITLFVSNVPKPLEIFRLLLSRPRAALAVLKFGAMGLGPATAAVRRGDLEAGMRLFGAAVLGRTFYQRLSETRREQMRVNSIRAEFLGSGFPPLDAIRVGRVQTPALLINGGQSPALFRCLVDRLEELLPHNERVQIDRASHIVHEDDPAAYNRAVLSFLAKHGSTETPNA